MFGRLRKNITASNFGTLALELVVVILGILTAFQFDRWAEDRRDREHEFDYLVRLKSDLQIEIQSMGAALQHAESRIAAVALLEDVLADSSVALERPVAVAAAVETATWRSFPQLNAFVYFELQSIETGEWGSTKSDISSDRAVQITQELARRQDAIQLLPNIAQHHWFNLKVIEAARGRTLKLVELIDSLIEEFER